MARALAGRAVESAGRCPSIYATPCAQRRSLTCEIAHGLGRVLSAHGTGDNCKLCYRPAFPRATCPWTTASVRLLRVCSSWFACSLLVLTASIVCPEQVDQRLALGDKDADCLALAVIAFVAQPNPRHLAAELAEVVHVPLVERLLGALGVFVDAKPVRAFIANFLVPDSDFLPVLF